MSYRVIIEKDRKKKRETKLSDYAENNTAVASAGSNKTANILVTWILVK